MKSRNYSYDYLRGFSAIMIVLCHISLGLSKEIGSFLGGTFVDVFILLSAYLLGLGSREIMINPLNFFKRRVVRLIPTYYTFLTISFVLIIIFLGFDNISCRQIFGHYLFLNWFFDSTRVYKPPLPNYGHLWFMSCILFGYLLVLGYSYLLKYAKFLRSVCAWIIFVCIFTLSATVFTIKHHEAIYPFTAIISFTLVFFKGKNIMYWLRNINYFLLITLFILINIISIILYLNGWYRYSGLIFWVNLVNAVMWIAVAPIVFSQHHINRIVLFLSTYSFEIYLIHHPLCIGKYSLTNLMPSGLAAVLIFLFSILGGWCLSKLTNVMWPRIK